MYDGGDETGRQLRVVPSRMVVATLWAVVATLMLLIGTIYFLQQGNQRIEREETTLRQLEKQDSAQSSAYRQFAKRQLGSATDDIGKLIVTSKMSADKTLGILCTLIVIGVEDATTKQAKATDTSLEKFCPAQYLPKGRPTGSRAP